ncbi:MAG TPA: type II secretion system secretin GspD [Burkholderiales bacterium]|nr:type II secretion system secretin GspD [Burkholderiales bacterium]
MAATGAAQAPEQPPQPEAAAEDTVTLNFVNADIAAVVKAVAEMTGRNFLIDPRVQGTVNIIAPKPVPRNLVFPILLSALRVQGFAAVGGDLGYINIVPESDAKFYGGLRAAQARGDQIVTEVFRLQFESAPQLVATLRPLITPNNVINAFPASNSIVITDYASNLARIRKVIASVDQPQPAQLTAIKLRFAAAIDVGQAVQRLMPELAQPPAPGAAPRATVSVDTRTNSLLVRADNPALTKRMQELAEKMDLPTAAGGNIRVIYLKNAQAERLAEALRAIVTGQPVARAAAAGTTLGPPGAPGAAPPPPPPSPAAIPTAATAGPAASVAGALASASIQAYPETNSLVIIAPDAVYQALRGVIEQLDARRAQVYVEALIVEVTATKAAEFGIQWQAFPSNPGSGATQGFGIQNFNASPGSNIGQIGQDPKTLGQGLSLGLIRGKITLAGVEILNIAALIRALQTDATANILSTPTLLTLDNEEAKIQVGQNIPIVTGSFSTLAGAGGAVVNPFQTFERRDIGVTLKIRPQIAEGGTVKLTLYQEVSSIFNATNPTGIILNKRSLESQVLVDDGQIIVLGGLISDDVQTSNQAVPGLGDIPILGLLFRYDTRQRTKTNLMVFLRPVVLRDAPTSAGLTADRYDIIRNLQGAQQVPNQIPLPSMSGPQLPPQLAPLAPGQPAVPPLAPQPPAETPPPVAPIAPQ